MDENEIWMLVLGRVYRKLESDFGKTLASEISRKNNFSVEDGEVKIKGNSPKESVDSLVQVFFEKYGVMGESLIYEIIGREFMQIKN